MAQEPRDIVLELLRRIDRNVDGLSKDLISLTLRMAAVERHLAGLVTSDVDHNSELDRLKSRVNRIEHRLELTDPAD